LGFHGSGSEHALHWQCCQEQQQQVQQHSVAAAQAVLAQAEGAREQPAKMGNGVQISSRRRTLLLALHLLEA
jgi:hypothetical protein